MESSAASVAPPDGGTRRFLEDSIASYYEEQDPSVIRNEEETHPAMSVILIVLFLGLLLFAMIYFCWVRPRRLEEAEDSMRIISGDSSGEDEMERPQIPIGEATSAFIAMEVQEKASRARIHTQTLHHPPTQHPDDTVV